jgi:hypothetical protein
MFQDEIAEAAIFSTPPHAMSTLIIDNAAFPIKAPGVSGAGSLIALDWSKTAIRRRPEAAASSWTP